MTDTNKGRANNAEGTKEFPAQIDGDVYFCGVNSAKPTSENSYFVKHAKGNWLFNTPKFQASLVKKLEDMGGVAFIFLSQREDANQSEKFAEHFKAKRIIHRHDAEAQPHAEVVLSETEPYEYQPDFTLIPAPGHTEGHMMMLYKNKYLFSGSSLAFEAGESKLELCDPLSTWYSYEEQIMSMEKLLNFEFEWLLPVHGESAHLDKKQMKEKLQEAIDRAWSVTTAEDASEERVRLLEEYGKLLESTEQPEYAKLILAKAAWLKTLIK